ncbi:MAG: hypothetical protein EGQ25_00960 [Catenibacterium mitsuokai]|nr:hypothetical protein [Catenibacterium mitsuokai]
MINAEKYKDEINEEYLNLLKRNVIDGDGNRMNKAIKTIAYKHCGKQLCGASSTFKWLCEEYKEPIKLSKLEYDILEYLSDNTKHMYIVRDGNGNIFLYDVEPEKSKSAPWWTGRGMCHMNMFNKLFQFVQFEDEEPRAIKDILESCEVVNDAEE